MKKEINLKSSENYRIAAKRRWCDVAYRKKMVKAAKVRFERMGERELFSQLMKKSHARQKVKNKVSEAQTKRFEKKEERLKLSDAAKKFWEKDSKSKKMKDKMSKVQMGENNPMKRSEVRIKMKSALRKHHIYLKGNGDETIELINSKHVQLHYGAYEYIYCKYGKEGIDDFLKWFDKKYGLV